jgi:histidinol-phosphate aminotransferase
MKRYTPNELMRPNILQLTPYSSARNEFSGEGSIFLDANENYKDFIGTSARNRYPDPSHQELKKQIAKSLDLEGKSIVIGNGSDELIDLLFRIFCTPQKDKVLMISPTYGAYQVFADINDVGVSQCPLKDDFTIDTNRLETQCHLINSGSVETGMHKLFFLCSPNNPTGNSFSLKQIETIANRFVGITVVDEAYIDFSERESAVSLIEKNDRIVVLRTLSKAWGLANVRIGIAIASPSIIKIMHHVKYPYNLSGIQQELAIEALQKREEVLLTVAEIKSERERVAKELKKFPFVQKVFPSDANFILARFDDAPMVYSMLLKKGIIIRKRTSLRGCYGCLRLTIGSVEENDAVLAALESLKEQL